ncbi:GNAT family protein [Aequorivita sp. Q41]|uniref:GNAT family N-acetyltransferase n=1 Tax=Aequorivita sp. Q41 TaxID=3153300 RepID=UPI003242F8E2
MRVFLRAFNKTDSEIIYPWLCDQEVLSLTGGNSYFASKDYVDKWTENKIFNTKDYYLAICLNETQEMIGYLSINDIDHQNRKAVWGGLLIGNKNYWGKGIATEAATLMLKFVFEELNVNLFWAFWLEEHTASIKLGEKLGFKKIGILPQSLFKAGKFHNQCLMYILKEDYIQNPE